MSQDYGSDFDRLETEWAAEDAAKERKDMDANQDYETGDFGEPLNKRKAGKAVLDNEDPREEVVIERLAHAHCCEVCDQARAELQTLRDMVTQWHITTNGMILAIENDVRMRLGMPPVDAGLLMKDEEES